MATLAIEVWTGLAPFTTCASSSWTTTRSCSSATTYDGDWDPYIDDFATKIPDILDLQFGEVEGWPGIRSPEIKDFIVKHQIPAHFWYVANPNLTVVETRRLEKIGKAVDEFLDKVA